MTNPPASPHRLVIALTALVGLILLASLIPGGRSPVRAQPSTATPSAPTPTALPTPADLIVDGSRVSLSGEQTYRRVIIRNRGRLEIQPYSGSDATGIVTIHADYFELDRTSSIIGDLAGYRGRSRQTGEGPGGGEGGLNSFDGGGGGAYGGDGGAGVLDGQGQPAARGGRSYGRDCSAEIERGSAGGAPGSADNSGDLGAGGRGGGAIAILSDTVIITGTIQLSGGDGAVVANDAAGGGAGGGLWIQARHAEFAGRVEANGGRGGETDDGGGGGGGGRVKIFYLSGNVERRAIQVNGGKGDGNGYPNDGRRGSICVQQIPATPTPVYSATPSDTPTATLTPTPEPSPTPEFSPTPTATDTPTATLTPLPTATPTASNTPTPTPEPRALFLPLLLREQCPKVEAAPLAIVLVIDASTSMRGMTRAGRSKLEAAVEAARLPVSWVGGRSRLALVAFNDRAWTLSELTSDRVQLGAALDSLDSAEGSRLDAGLREALRALESAEAGSERRVVVLTDGRPSPSTPADVRLAAAELRAAGIVLDSIGLGEDLDASLLAEIASSPDRYHHAPDAEDLSALFSDLRWTPPACGGAKLWPAPKGIGYKLSAIDRSQCFLLHPRSSRDCAHLAPSSPNPFSPGGRRGWGMRGNRATVSPDRSAPRLLDIGRRSLTCDRCP
jgi:Mg-chelatase subunit ChlD